jgi:disulfide oxidoreductase YuzD
MVNHPENIEVNDFTEVSLKRKKTIENLRSSYFDVNKLFAQRDAEQSFPC